MCIQEAGRNNRLLCPAPNRRGIKRCFCLTSVCLSSVCLSDVCLSVAYIGPKSRTERPRKTKIGTEVAHLTGDSDTISRSKVKGPGHQAALLSAALTRKRLQRSAWKSIRHGKVLLRCVCSAARDALGRPRAGEERGILCRHAHSLIYSVFAGSDVGSQLK